MVGLISVVLVLLGNPANMGFCIACFLRDIAGGLGLHRAPVVQYIRPEIIGLVLGSMIMALAGKEFKVRGGSSPVSRFVLGFIMMVGALMFLGCPLRMILRLAGGDLNALVVGALAQKTRLCTAGGIRDAIMFKEFHLRSGFIAIFAAVLVGNLILRCPAVSPLPAAPVCALGWLLRPRPWRTRIWTRFTARGTTGSFTKARNRNTTARGANCSACPSLSKYYFDKLGHFSSH